MDLTIGGIRRRYRNRVELARDVRDYREAKRNRGDQRKPLLTANGEATSVFEAHDYRGFRRYLDALTDNPDLNGAVDRLLSLEHALAKRHGIPLPKPREIQVTADMQLGVFWGPEGKGITVLASDQGLVALIGGTTGRALRGDSAELLDALKFQGALSGA